MVLILFSFCFVYVVFIGVIVLLWLGCQRVVMHLQDKPEATQAVIEHVLMPLFRDTETTSTTSS